MGRDQKKVDSAVDSLKSSSTSKGGSVSVSGVVGDLKKPETMAAVIKQAVDIMGGLDILVISGGNGYSEYLGLGPDDASAYRMMHDVGVLSPLFLTEAAIPELTKSTTTPGTVVMVSSMAPLVPWPDTAPYNYAKAAQNTMIETLAFKYRTANVRINGVLPACIHTGALDVMAAKKKANIDEYAKLRADAHPMGRNGTPQDVANSIVFLASPASAFTTGELLKVDGGLHLSNWFNKPKILKEFVGGL
jgi:NAD(P)-dependent dehydrogenase (short-subunit alcohol dehydrogenase family)